MTQELEYVQSVNTCLQQSVHALECSFPQIQTIVHLVLEGSHLHLSDQLLPLLRLVVELRQHLLQQVPDETGLVVG